MSLRAKRARKHEMKKKTCIILESIYTRKTHTIITTDMLKININD